LAGEPAAHLSLAVNIIVVGNTHRKALVTDYLKFRFIQHNCADYDLPNGWVDQHKVVFNPTGCYRAFRGHQDALAHVKTVSLVFEDDAVPHTFNWSGLALSALSYLDDFDWISLHGREFDLAALQLVTDLGNGYKLYTPIDHPVGITGCCMAYWIKKSTADRYREAVFDGMPCDLFLWQNFKAAIIDPSPFLHDRSQGSLIDVGARE